MDNEFNDIQNELQRLILEINRVRFNNRSRNVNSRTRTRTTENADIINFLRELLYLYNANIREYQDNMRMMLQIVYLLLNNQNNSAPRRNTNSSDLNNDFYYYYTRRIPTNTGRAFGTPINTFNENVIVAPTQQQIETATTNFDYSTETPENNTNCPITLEEFHDGEPVVRITHCGHTFRRDAINNWFRQNVRCPVCRYDIRNNTEETSQPTNTIPTNTTPNTITETDIYNALRSSITNSLSEIMNEYYSEVDASHNLLYTFEFPIIYNDVSNNPIPR
jgi:Ring finger domain